MIFWRNPLLFFLYKKQNASNARNGYKRALNDILFFISLEFLTILFLFLVPVHRKIYDDDSFITSNERQNNDQKIKFIFRSVPRRLEKHCNIKMKGKHKMGKNKYSHQEFNFQLSD